MNNFIVSGKGFLKSTTFNIDSKQIDIEWTRVLREAQRFNTKTAVNIIAKNGLEAFVWNPFKEEPVKGKWEAIQRKDHHDFFNDEDHKSLEWRPMRAFLEKRTDVNFLSSNGVEKTKFYDSYEEALAVCQERNKEIIEELQEKMEKMLKV